MKKLINYSVKEYSALLSARVPAPGGGSAAALTGSLGAALITMVANYSIKKDTLPKEVKRFKSLIKKSEQYRKRLLELVDLDAKAYMNVVKSKGKSSAIKQKALRAAAGVPKEICNLCYQSMGLTGDLVKYGNKYLMSDVEVAVELLISSFNSALVMLRVNK